MSYSAWSSPDYLGAVAPPSPEVTTPPAWAAPGLPPGGCFPSPEWGDDVSAVPLSRAAMYQLAKAYAGYRLASGEQAEDAAMFSTPPTTTATAYLKAGYWMAVGARVAGSRLLAAQAQVAISKGNGLLAVTVGQYEQVASGVSAILRDGAAAVRGYAGNNPAVLAVASRLDALALAADTLGAKEQRAKQTLTPLDDLAVAGEKYGRYALVGGTLLVGAAALWLLHSNSAKKT